MPPWQRNQQKVDVAVCTPTRGWVKTEWSTHLRLMQFPGTTIFISDKYNPLDICRNVLAQSAIEKFHAERIFFLDDDVLPPLDAVARLIAFQDYLMNQPDDEKHPDGRPVNPRMPSGFKKYGPVVSGLYWAKKIAKDGKFQKGHAAAWRASNDPTMPFSPIIPESFGENNLVECDVVGAGCMLVHRSVFEKLSKPWFKWNVNLQTPLPPGEFPVSEDFYFNIKATNELGVKPVVLKDIVCKHLADAVVVEDGDLTLSVR